MNDLDKLFAFLTLDASVRLLAITAGAEAGGVLYRDESTRRDAGPGDRLVLDPPPASAFRLAGVVFYELTGARTLAVLGATPDAVGAAAWDLYARCEFVGVQLDEGVVAFTFDAGPRLWRRVGVVSAAAPPAP